MTNDFEVRGDTLVIYIDRRDGTRLEAVVDLFDADKVLSHPGKWCALKHPTARTYYVYGKVREGDRVRQVYLHRLILDAPPHLLVDHVDHNGLNNRRSNLRLATAVQNGQNRRGANRNNTTSGVRGVTWHPQSGKWRACVWVNRRRFCLGLYGTLEEAAEAVRRGRARLMAFSKEANAKLSA